ncbi:FAD-binding oxidoreductase [Kribbella sindirgiensis]|uniref:FAD-binding oxidoreductase n=1 Tax=Kribbella sindirgiensis TaxID=1124744 RepID=A0A4R0JBK7_9ACTN|nr:FAD-binding oxidoreductase [Kribbella sindirgiensis]TCC43367.1 FAD-binding oxidoreductase [Kribbella sindirgiensis]
MMLTTTSNRYDEARLGFQRRDSHRPAVIFPVTSTAEVEEAVRYAIDHDLRIAVQASGHGLTQGIDGGVLIATGSFKNVTVDAKAKTAWIDAGATWRDVLDATAPYGLAPLSGSAPGVGAISYTLGGGLGLMARRFGYAADHVRRIEVVTADGVRRDAEEDPDLFWALRGGGGNFGVVTGIEIELFDVPTLYGGSLYFDLAEHPTVPELWRDWTRSVPEEVTSAIAILPMPNIPQVPAPLRGKYIGQVQLAILGDRGEDLIGPLRAIGKPALDTVGELPYVDSGKIFAEPERPDSYTSLNVLLKDLDALETLPELAGPGASRMHVIAIRHLGGALARPPEVPNAIGHRDAAYSLTVLTPGKGDAGRDVLEPWTASTVGRALNFTFAKLTDDEIAEAYDDYERLAALRHRYDPTRRLHASHPL